MCTSAAIRPNDYRHLICNDGGWGIGDEGVEPWRRGASGIGAGAVRPVMVEPEPVESDLKQAGDQGFPGNP